MLDSEKQVQQRLPISLLKVKFGSPGDSDEETEEDALTATPNAGDLKDDNLEDGDPVVRSSSTQSLGDQIHAFTTLFDTYWDES